MRSETLADLGLALSKAQGEFPAVPRDKTVRVRTKTGGEYSFNYAPLDSVLGHLRPVLVKHGLAITQLLDEGPSLTTMLLHSSGEFLASSMPLPLTAGMSAQEIGSAVTYMRRYAIVALLGIATEEDDDGNHAAGNTVKSSAGDHALAVNGAPTPGPAVDKPVPQASPASTFVAPDLKGGDHEVRVHFGTNKGKALGSLTEKQLSWYANQWEPNPNFATTEDFEVQAAARRLFNGQSEPVAAAVGGGPMPDDGIPFTWTWA